MDIPNKVKSDFSILPPSPETLVQQIHVMVCLVEEASPTGEGGQV